METNGSDIDSAAGWLARHLAPLDLQELLDTDDNGLHEAIACLGVRSSKTSKPELVQSVLRRFDTELLADQFRRRVVTRGFNRKHRRKMRVPSKWFRGGPQALSFVNELGLPPAFAGARAATPPAFEDIEAYPPLGELHSYQEDLYDGIADVLHARNWRDRRGLVWLPTGTGKTRVTVEALLRECNLDGHRNVILWIADRAELCEQAVEAFRHVWQQVGWDQRSRTGASRIPSLRITRFWGAREYAPPPAFPTVVVASIQKLASGLLDRGELNEVFEEELALLGQRAAAIVFDEAHHVVAPSWTRVMRALGLDRRKNYLGDNRRSAPPLFGLTATPARRANDETTALCRRFEGRLIEPRGRKYKSLRGFVDGGFLSKHQFRKFDTGYELTMSASESEQWSRFGVVPRKALSRAGQDPNRSANIAREVVRQTQRKRSVLTFACSIDHALTLAELFRHLGETAVGIHGEMPKPARQAAIRAFRRGEVKHLVNCDLLTTGFDAPKIDTVVLARPVDSPVLLTQMIGRGLRGPSNGGTKRCLVVDCEDSAGPYSGLDELRRQFRQQWVDFE